MIKLLLICLLVLGTTTVFSLTPMQTLLKYTTPSDSSWGCVNFTPYVHGYNPDYGPHPPTSVIDELLDVIVTQTKFKCIQTYGVLHNLTHTFEAAKIRGLKVVMVIWLEPFPANNTESIDIGIKMAKKYKDTIVGVSCGSEMRVRNALAIANPPVLECMQQVKAAGVVQPMTSNDYYWFWCDAQRPCKQWEAVVNLVDYVGINAFPWWENQHAPACVPAEEAPEMHLAMYKEVVATYPTKTVIITEFGWPGGPDGATEINDFTNKPCTGVASESNQTYVLEKSIELLQKNKVPGITFCAFRETWKTGHEGEIASYWGFCDNTPPYKCKKLFGYEGTGGEQQESNEVSSSDEEPQNRTSAASTPTLSIMVLIGTIVYLISFMSAPKLSLLHQSLI